MALAALISATREAREPGVPLRATLPLAGRTLIERQALLAAAAGVERIIVMVEAVPAELVRALERLREEGLDVVTARTAGEAAAAVPVGSRLLMIADGLIGDASHFDRLLSGDRPSLLAVGDRGHDERFERIDAATRWAGLALLDGDLLHDVAAMPAEWDLQSTLLRRALQTGVMPLAIDDRTDPGLAIVERQQDFAELQRRILEGAGTLPTNWLGRYVLVPIEQAATGAIAAGPLTPVLVGGAAVGLSLLGALAFGLGWRGAGLIALLLALPLEGIALRLARVRLQRVPPQSWWRLLVPVLSAAALLALGRTMAPTHGWGMLLLAAMTVAFMLALRQEVRGSDVPGGLWLADASSLTVILLPFALAGRWGVGVAAVFAYAAGSFFWAQYHVHRDD